MFIAKRYLVSYFLTSLLWIIASGVSVWFLEGVVPVLVVLTTIVWMLGYLPYSVKQDYNKIRDIISDTKKMKSGELSKQEYADKLVDTIMEEIDLPLDLVQKQVEKYAF
jgi:hypothetical protein